MQKPHKSKKFSKHVMSISNFLLGNGELLPKEGGTQLDTILQSHGVSYPNPCAEICK